jgi:hypothetical protein
LLSLDGLFCRNSGAADGQSYGARQCAPERSEVDFYWGLHFALAMVQQIIRDSERLIKLSERQVLLARPGRE